MKPIKLVVKGLNSFKEEQTIDFNKLTDRGLFGIFGPTGSGKSTILDGMTLALYGRTSRDSSNFINTQCDEMNVRYEFRIRDNEEKQYIIDRTFKRNKDGGINAKKPTRIIQVVDGKEEILEEAASSVDKKCIEILGLKFEDFIRTVVLPQGKFSEFLKLGGKPRRDMLERLFSLDKYGEGLARKLGSAIKKENSEMDKLTGELKGYENVSKALYNDKSKELEAAEYKESRVKEELKEVTKKYLDSENIWNLQKELENHLKEKNELESQKENIEKYKIQVEKGSSVLKIKPYIDAVDRTLKEIRETEENLLKDKTLFEKLKENKEKINIAFEEVKIKKDTDIPKLKVVENNINEAIKEEQLRIKLSEEVINLRKEYKILKENEKHEDEMIKKLEKEIEELNKTIKLSEENVEEIKIDEVHRSNVQRGLILQENLEEKNKRKNQLEKNKKQISDKIEILTKKIESYKSPMEEKKKNLNYIEKELKEIINNCPGDSAILLEMQKKISNLTIVAELGNKYRKELMELNSEIIKLIELIGTKKIEKVQIEKEIEDLKRTIEELERENLASALRSNLKENMPCPVCGSREHFYINNEKVDEATLGDKKKMLDSQQNRLQFIGSELAVDGAKLNSNIERKNNVEEELVKLGEEWINVNIGELKDKFKSKDEEIKKWISTKENLENKKNKLNEELNIINLNYIEDQSSLNENKNVLNKYSEDLNLVSEEFYSRLTEFNDLKIELKIEDFLKRDKEIKELDKKRDLLEKVIKENRDKIKNKEEEKEKHKNASNDITNKIAEIRIQGEEKSKQVEEKNQSIKNKAGERTDLDTYKNEIVNEIKVIETAFVNIDKKKNEIEKQYNDCDKNLKVFENQLNNSNLRLENDNFKLEESLRLEGFKDKEEAVSFYIPSDKIKELKDFITEYENNFNQLEGKIKNVVGKINGRTLTNEQWDEIKKLKADKDAELKEASGNVVKINTELNEMKKNLDKLKDLLKEKEKLNHKLDLLKDLDGLFKGKRFVEFVAMHQLKYVSLEASKRLKEITNGIYGLEVDEDGKFIIRDYKNGGATRDASTLSGGETFLASLSLALALSAQIQLKGTAPLELFFLDEGFGTLDDNLLEIVMSSLEKIHNDRLSVGIISHVESIKNRVPVKLIISPSEAGIGGSKVKIERT